MWIRQLRLDLAALSSVVSQIAIKYRDIRGVIWPMAFCFVMACAHSPLSVELRIDSSTEASFTASWDRLYRSLTSQQQSQLTLAIPVIAMAQYGSFLDVPDSLKRGFGPLAIRDQINGMRFNEIIELSRKSPIKVEVRPAPG